MIGSANDLNANNAKGYLEMSDDAILNVLGTKMVIGSSGTTGYTSTGTVVLNGYARVNLGSTAAGYSKQLVLGSGTGAYGALVMNDDASVWCGSLYLVNGKITMDGYATIRAYGIQRLGTYNYSDYVPNTSGTGVLEMSGNSQFIAVNNSIYIGDGEGSSGDNPGASKAIITLNDSAMISAYSYIAIARGGGIATVTLNDSSQIIQTNVNQFVVGDNVSNGTLTMNDQSSVGAGGDFYIAKDSGTGVLNMNNITTLTMGQGSGFSMGTGSNAYAALNMSGTSTIVMNSATTVAKIGDFTDAGAGTAIINMSDSAQFNTQGIFTFAHRGGTNALAVLTLEDNALLKVLGGTGTNAYEGGFFYGRRDSSAQSNTVFSGSSYILLNGGTIATTFIGVGGLLESNANNNYLRANGGSIQALQNEADFFRWTISTNTSAYQGRLYVKLAEGGLKFDTQSYNVGILTGLHHDATATTDGGLTKRGTGTLTLSGGGDYNGVTRVEGGTLVIDTVALTGHGNVELLASTILVVDGLTQAFGTLSIAGSVTLDFGTGSGATSLSFADSHVTSWSGGTLTIVNFNTGDSLRFGTDSSALTAAQLEQIWYNGSNNYTLDANGYLMIPEPSTWALLALGVTLLGLGCRRKKIAT